MIEALTAAVYNKMADVVMARVTLCSLMNLINVINT